jgi:hypothetical protein
MREARAALELTECHGPLMHASYLHHLRRLLNAQGARLGDALPRPSDIVHLSLSELARGGLPIGEDIINRRTAYEDACAAPLPPVLMFDTSDAPDVTDHRRAPPQLLPGSRRWRRVAGSPGLAQGRLVAVRRPSEVGHVMPGDVTLVPDAGAVWRWVGLGVRALLVEDGRLLSHAVTTARELGIPCVLDCPGLTAVVGEGKTAQVDGRKELVRW